MSTEQYNDVCKAEFKEIKDALNAMEKRLFKDNGTRSIQSILNDQAAWQRNHDKNHDKENTAEVTKLSSNTFSEWLMENWKTVASVIFIAVWVATQFYPVNRGLDVEQQKEIKDLLKTVIVDTRPDFKDNY